jgi:hypothetical protein
MIKSGPCGEPETTWRAQSISARVLASLTGGCPIRAIKQARSLSLLTKRSIAAQTVKELSPSIKRECHIILL